MIAAERHIQLLRLLLNSGRPVTAEQLAAELRTTAPKVRGDIEALRGQGFAIAGEADTGFELQQDGRPAAPSFTEDEIEAILVGLCGVLEDEDSELQEAAADARDKLAALLPEPVSDPEDWTGADFTDRREMVRAIDSAVLTERALLIAYRDGKGNDSSRRIWPLLGPGSWVRGRYGCGLVRAPPGLPQLPGGPHPVSARAGPLFGAEARASRGVAGAAR